MAAWLPVLSTRCWARRFGRHRISAIETSLIDGDIASAALGATLPHRAAHISGVCRPLPACAYGELFGAVMRLTRERMRLGPGPR